MSMTSTKRTGASLKAGNQYTNFTESIAKVTEAEVVFHNGLSAFEDHTLFTYRKETRLKPFIYMHSSVDPNVSFVCVDPFILTPSYEVRLTEENMRSLNLASLDDVLILCLVSVGKDMYTTTANLMSPVVINTRTLEAEQIIMEDMAPESLRYNVWNSIGHNTMTVRK